MAFVTQTYGKWILAGEHAVLRGSPALVFPARDFAMTFEYNQSRSPLNVIFSGPNGDDLKLFFWSLVENSLQKLNRNRSDLNGELVINSTLPLGAGLGASAALCVGIVRLFIELGFSNPDHLYEHSRQLEGMFHGESSGVDIAVAVANAGIRFLRGGERKLVSTNWQPLFYLSYSGERGATADCVRRVNELRRLSPHLGDRIDDEMKTAVLQAEIALISDREKGFGQLVEALGIAKNCFVQWGLADGKLGRHLEELNQAGAAAAKPTGSGGGGYVLSLWDQEPPEDIRHRLIRVSF